MTALSQVLIAISILACGVVYGTDVFAATVLRPALALVDDRTLSCTMGRVHDFADRRMRVPGVSGLCAAISGTVAAVGRLRAATARWGDNDRFAKLMDELREAPEQSTDHWPRRRPLMAVCRPDD